MKNLIGLPPLPTLNSDRDTQGHATKVSWTLTEQVKEIMQRRYRGVKLTKRAALEVALSEWLEGALGAEGDAGR
jgi:hypothetical protein